MDNANDPSTSGGHEQAMPKSETSSSAGKGMTALDILSSCALELSEKVGVVGGDNVAPRERKVPMPPPVVSPTTPEVSVSPSTMTTARAAGEGTMTETVSKAPRQRCTEPHPLCVSTNAATPIHKKTTLVRPREVSACSDGSANDSATFDAAAIAASSASSFSDTLSSCVGDVAQPITQRLRSSMEQSRHSLHFLQEWDRRLGLPKSSAHTCVKTERSRKQLLEGKILKKWDGTPLISFERDVNGAILVKTGNKPKQRGKKKAKKESTGDSEKEIEKQEAASPAPPSANKKKKGRGSHRQQAL
mmetsp:Transcript_3315/g.9525  ORF Transcript_3315/g.9525 Transcript_3315/m.9525 type:complete len:303 (+) Transcript_3315:144-1052(+)|eukprot:CAMPEP_0181047594 /NCGR_PEP_ID=MMETSP1070-20121207/14966_1 /TAXON_ID=265543 /ORGANISM="Minutocellus polymorphus, Strain NH13" /LENGTH=302 /DNA_ID=CAMNT_0023126283 /DNA_START=93 /DNA_END=1001 /DNA_ORIENTATION=-